MLYACSIRVMNLRLLEETEMLVPGKKLVDIKANRVSAAFSVLGQCLFVQPQVVSESRNEHIASG